MRKGNLKKNYWILFQTNEDSKQATLQGIPLSHAACFQSENSLRAASSMPLHLIASIVAVIL